MTSHGLLILGFVWTSILTSAGPLEVEREWTDRVEPVMDRHCFKCHGGVRQRGELDLRSLENMLKGGETGPAIMPGKPEESNIFKFIHAEADPHMPPKKQLGSEEIDILSQWIARLPTFEALGVSTGGEYAAALAKTRAPVWNPPSGLPPSAAIDRFIELGWRERKVQGAETCDDAAFARRVYLDLAGRIPSLEELNRFLQDPSRERLVDALLAGDDYPRHMREVFDVVLMERRGARAESQRLENQWFRFLEDSFRANRPWNEMVRELILARPGETNNRGAVWFLYERKDNFQGIAEAVAPVAFGVNIGCAQCHNHPLAWEIEQRHYWGLVAAFNRGKNVNADEGIGVAESAIGGFVNFANLKKESQPALLAFLNGKSVEEKRPAEGENETDDPLLYLVPPPAEKAKPAKPAVPRMSRREALADAATRDNPQLARAFVNRIWAMLLGRGLVHPVDRLDSKHPASHPDLLDWLARDFEENGYDVKRLIRQIILSGTYQLDSRSASGEASPPQAFARALEKPLSAEQLFRSFLIATGHTSTNESAYRRAFVEKFPDLFPEEYNATLQQATFVSNSPLLDKLLNPAPANTTERLLALDSPEKQVFQAFQVVLGREPATDEMDRCRRILDRRPGEAGLRQLLWALLASAEFQLNH